MITISLCMIVRDEQDTLPRCLSSVAAACDEIVIADTGSRDKTKDAAAAFSARIYDFAWCDDFAAARNFAYSHARMDYIMWLDADDVLEPMSLAALLRLKETLPDGTDVVMMRYILGKTPDGGAGTVFYRERLTKRSRGFIWREPVHEYLETGGTRIYSEVEVTHQKPPGRGGGRNIAIYEALLARGESLTPRGMYYYARELCDHKRRAEAELWFERFLDTGLGWTEDNIGACNALSRCFLADGRIYEAKRAVLRGFCYDRPRAKGCCILGECFRRENALTQAAYWYEQALAAEGGDTQGFYEADYGGYIPCMELVVIYDRLGRRAEAIAYNERAAGYRPDCPAVRHNRLYFAGMDGGGAG